MSETTRRTSRTLQVLEREFDTLFDRVPGLYGVLFCTADGDPIVERFERQMDRDRLAAMASSLVALGGTMARTGGQQHCDYMIVQSHDGFIVSLHIGRNLLLSALARRDTSLGMLLSSCRATSESVSARMSGAPITPRGGQSDEQDR